MYPHVIAPCKMVGGLRQGQAMPLTWVGLDTEMLGLIIIFESQFCDFAEAHRKQISM